VITSNNSKSLSNIKIFNRASDLVKSFGGDIGIDFGSFGASPNLTCRFVGIFFYSANVGDCRFFVRTFNLLPI
jgi:hypothetical protein